MRPRTGATRSGVRVKTSQNRLMKSANQIKVTFGRDKSSKEKVNSTLASMLTSQVGTLGAGGGIVAQREIDDQNIVRAMHGRPLSTTNASQIFNQGSLRHKMRPERGANVTSMNLNGQAPI